jgi:hypothetical protein
MEPVASELVLHSRASPITELRIAYFPVAITDIDQAIFEGNIAEFFLRLRSHATEMTGFSAGWSLEPLTVADTPQEGKAHVTCVGWQSIEAHEAFLKSKALRDHENLIINSAGAIYSEIVQFTGIRFK